MRHSNLPARVAKEHSETAYMTDRAMATIAELGDEAWCMHLSYIKPHWPYMAPAPYHALYGPDDVAAANRTESEKTDPHPVIAAFMEHEESVNFAREEVRQRVIPAYMGLITEIDDHIGRLVSFLEDSGRMDDTLIVFTSDHGDYLGDHWLGEKEMFHEESLRIPLIVVDPDAAADATRGSVDDRPVESIDLVPTFIEALGGAARGHVLEGRSLMRCCCTALRSNGATPSSPRPTTPFAALAIRSAARPTKPAPTWSGTERWKYVSFDHDRPQLFDLEADPKELRDLGASAAHGQVRADMEARIAQWLRQRKRRTTISDAAIGPRTDSHKKRGYLFGVW